MAAGALTWGHKMHCKGVMGTRKWAQAVTGNPETGRLKTWQWSVKEMQTQSWAKQF